MMEWWQGFLAARRKPKKPVAPLQSRAEEWPGGLDAEVAADYVLPPELREKYEQAKNGEYPLVTDREWNAMRAKAILDAWDSSSGVIVLSRETPEEDVYTMANEQYNMKQRSAGFSGGADAPGFYESAPAEPAPFDPFADDEADAEINDDAINGFTDEEDAVIGDENDPKNA